MEGFGSDGVSPWGAASPSSSSSSLPGRRQDKALCSECDDRQGGHREENEDFLSGVGSKMSTGLWSTVGLVGSLAGRAKNAADSTVAQAQTEGWWDTALGAARQSVNSAVETTTWAAERSVEAVGAAVSHVKESDGKAILGKTSEVLDSTARKSMTAVESSVEWVTEQLGNLGVQDSRAGLSKMSSGTMQGFGSDFPPPSMASPTAGNC
mmetsp:Transcript_43334/g.136998  ORF Transcript_43334/g.136998 Transcript_43334/m.136998 type:complete len:209 (-) Transcript_43334:321-947(-)